MEASVVTVACGVLCCLYSIAPISMTIRSTQSSVFHVDARSTTIALRTGLICLITILEIKHTYPQRNQCFWHRLSTMSASLAFKTLTLHFTSAVSERDGVAESMSTTIFALSHPVEVNRTPWMGLLMRQSSPKNVEEDIPTDGYCLPASSWMIACRGILVRCPSIFGMSSVLLT